MESKHKMGPGYQEGPPAVHFSLDLDDTGQKILWPLTLATTSQGHTWALVLAYVSLSQSRCLDCKNLGLRKKIKYFRRLQPCFWNTVKDRHIWHEIDLFFLNCRLLSPRFPQCCLQACPPRLPESIQDKVYCVRTVGPSPWLVRDR